MLQTFRNKKRSIFGIVIAGFCGLLMVPFGMDMIQRGGNQASAIEVDGADISYNDYYRRLTRLQESFRRQFGANYQQIAPMLKLEERAADDLINGALLDNFADEAGISASTEKIQQNIASHPYFQGQMTQNSLRAFIQAQGLTGAGLEKITKRQIVLNQLNQIFSDISRPSSVELESMYKEQNRKASFRYLEFKPETFLSKVNITDESALSSFFDKSKESYRTEKKVSFSTVAFNPEQFTSSVEIDEVDIQDAYNRDKSKFYEPRRAKLRHILFTKDHFTLTSTDENESKDAKNQRKVAGSEAAKAAAEDALKSYSDGEDFAEIAKRLSQDTKTKNSGGDLGWISYPVLQDVVRKEISRLSTGEVSQVIETKRGFEIFKLEEVKKKTLKPIDSVKDQLKARLQREDAPEYARIAGDEFFEEFQKEKEQNSALSLEEFAKKKNAKTIITSKPLGRTDKQIGITAELINKTLEFNPGSFETVVAGDRTYVVEIKDVVDSTIPEFSSVKDRVISSYKKEQSMELAKTSAQAAAKKASESSLNLNQIAGEYTLSPKSTGLIGKNDKLEAPFTSPDIKNVAFTLSKDSPVSIEALKLGSSYFLVELVNSKPGEMTDFEKEKEQLATSSKQKIGSGLINSLVETLRAKKDFKINPEILKSNQG